jgi:hypothetical protein
MMSSNEKGVEEVFAIKTNEIDFFAALVREESKQFSITGKVRFQDGRVWRFHHPSDNRDDLIATMFSLCNTIADFYRTKVFHLKFDRVIGYGEFIRLLREGIYAMN